MRGDQDRPCHVSWAAPREVQQNQGDKTIPRAALVLSGLHASETHQDTLWVLHSASLNHGIMERFGLEGIARDGARPAPRAACARVPPPSEHRISFEHLI